MKNNCIDALIILNNDPHHSEYLAPHWQAIQWLSGFSGSAATIVITLEHAILWTDFRYYIQAENQLKGFRFKLYKIGKPDVLTVKEYLLKALKPKDTIGIDGSLFSVANVNKYKSEFNTKGILLNTNTDFISILWKKRPLLPLSKAYSLSEKYAGKSRIKKIEQIRACMKEFGACLHLMATLDDIAWSLNLRGSDIHTNPVNIAYLLIEPLKITLFVNPDKIDDKLKKELKHDGIDIAQYEDIYIVLSKIADNKTILIDPENTNYKLFQSINKKTDIIKKPNPAIGLKSIKNKIEISHLKNTSIKDGTAIVNFLFWLENQKQDAGLNEIFCAKKLFEFRKKQDLFIDNSFDPIMAYGEHSAMCHYFASDQTNADFSIKKNNMLLIDSGGHYLTGTTDITRTICFGKPSKQQIKDYTLVLKGHIAVASTLFPKGTKGFQIDTLARQYLWNQGMDFGHGTGHGVGFFLSVHEGPASLSSHPVDVKLEKGMVLTNEPGVYRKDEYGIRLENMILVDQAFENEFGTFMKFENLTYCHFEKNLIDKNMLNEKEINWINDYHASVYENLSLSYGLDIDVRLWLKNKTGSL